MICAQACQLYIYGEASMGQLGCGDGDEAEIPFPKLAEPSIFDAPVRLPTPDLLGPCTDDAHITTSGKVSGASTIIVQCCGGSQGTSMLHEMCCCPTLTSVTRTCMAPEVDASI